MNQYIGIHTSDGKFYEFAPATPIIAKLDAAGIARENRGMYIDTAGDCCSMNYGVDCDSNTLWRIAADAT